MTQRVLHVCCFTVFCWTTPLRSPSLKLFAGLALPSDIVSEGGTSEQRERRPTLCAGKWWAGAAYQPLVPPYVYDPVLLMNSIGFS